MSNFTSLTVVTAAMSVVPPLRVQFNHSTTAGTSALLEVAAYIDGHNVRPYGHLPGHNTDLGGFWPMSDRYNTLRLSYMHELANDTHYILAV